MGDATDKPNGWHFSKADRQWFRVNGGSVVQIGPPGIRKGPTVVDIADEGSSFTMDLGSGNTASIDYEREGRIELENGDAIEGVAIEFVSVPDGFRQEGHGMRLLSAVLSTLDGPFILECDEGGEWTGGMSSAQLRDWYQSQGFVVEGRSSSGLIAMSLGIVDGGVEGEGEREFEYQGEMDIESLMAMIGQEDRRKRNAKAEAKGRDADDDNWDF